MKQQQPSMLSNGPCPQRLCCSYRLLISLSWSIVMRPVLGLGQFFIKATTL
jgi:hypothetical protein